ncbi:hypothetical protein KI387_022089, partial [Taxus chinensis]
MPRVIHVAERGKNSKIRFGLLRALNLQIAISFDPELGFPRSLYQRKAVEMLYMILGSISSFGA